jgi:hypothetical protein
VLKPKQDPSHRRGDQIRDRDEQQPEHRSERDQHDDLKGYKPSVRDPYVADEPSAIRQLERPGRPKRDESRGPTAADDEAEDTRGFEGPSTTTGLWSVPRASRLMDRASLTAQPVPSPSTARGYIARSTAMVPVHGFGVARKRRLIMYARLPARGRSDDRTLMFRGQFQQISICGYPP